MEERNSTLEDIIDGTTISNGDFVLITGNITKLLRKLKKDDKKFNLNIFIDKDLEKLGVNGTLAIQTFNWDFCDGKGYDINNSNSQTGSLGSAALKRDDFIRTKHPIYSFAVTGKYKNELELLNNKSAFGFGSPFDFMYKHKAKMIIFDLPLQNSFTFVHYVEEVNKVNYRYNKSFRSQYIDRNGFSSIMEYDMYVREIENNVLTSIEPLENIFIDGKAMKGNEVDNIKIKIIDFHISYRLIERDIKYNNAKSLYKIGRN